MKFQKMLIVGGGLLTILAFQNCGQGDYHVNPMAAESLNNSGETLTSNDNPFDSNIERMPTDISTAAPPVAPQPGTLPPDKSQVIDDSLDDISDDEIIQMCEKNKQHTNQMKVLMGPVLKNISGHSMILFNQIDLVENISGKTILQGQGDRRPIIHLVQNVSGATYVCDADVILISRSSGRLVVVRGQVSNVDGFSGNLRIVRGKLMSQPTNSSGVVIVNEVRVH